MLEDFLQKALYTVLMNMTKEELSKIDWLSTKIEH